jgi:hypothetical protein
MTPLPRRKSSFLMSRSLKVLLRSTWGPGPSNALVSCLWTFRCGVLLVTSPTSAGRVGARPQASLPVVIRTRPPSRGAPWRASLTFCFPNFSLHLDYAYILLEMSTINCYIFLTLVYEWLSRGRILSWKSQVKVWLWVQRTGREKSTVDAKLIIISKDYKQYNSNF